MKATHHKEGLTISVSVDELNLFSIVRVYAISRGYGAPRGHALRAARKVLKMLRRRDISSIHLRFRGDPQWTRTLTSRFVFVPLVEDASS